MAKKIRFPLKMKNDTEIRTLDELKEYFDLESVLGYFTDGRLATWLADRYYDEKAEAVSALSADTPDLNAKLCEILEVEYQPEKEVANLEDIQQRNEKLRILSSVTDDKEILENVDFVAMSQDELFDILNEQPEKIFLYGEKFEIPFGKKNVCYIGISNKNPIIILEGNKYLHEYEERAITFKNVIYDSSIYKKAEKLYLENNYKQAFPLLLESAINGDKVNQLRVGWMYETGNGVEKDYAKAFEWYRKSAEQGCSTAQCNLGLMYRYGKGTDKDYSKSLEWYNKAADQNHGRAQAEIGIFYEYGYSVEKDYTKAINWYKKSAENNYSWSQNKLGDMYYNGTGVSQDYTKATEFYNKAAKQGNKASYDKLGDIYFFGKGNVQQDYSKALDYYQKAESSNAKCQLGIMYENGYGVTQSYAKAYDLYTEAASTEDAEGMYHLGMLYKDGLGVAKDEDLAIQFIVAADALGSSSASLHITLLCTSFVLWFTSRFMKIAFDLDWDLDDPDSERIKLEKEEMFITLKKYSKNGCASAQKAFGDFYNGFDGHKYKELAIECYKAAAKQGNEEAKNSLEMMDINW